MQYSHPFTGALNRRLTKILATSLGAGALFLGAPSTEAQLIDNFSVAGLAEYTYTAVNEPTQELVDNIGFSDATGALVASTSGTTAIEQGFLLRNDFTLAIGQILMADVSFAAGTTPEMDFGIAVSSTATPTAATTGTLDTRQTFQWGTVSVRPSQNTVRTGFYDGVTQNTAGFSTISEELVSRLLIERTSSTQFVLGYIDTSAVRTNVTTVNFSNSNVGNALGFYVDMRATGQSLGSLDNLQIVPEPGTAVMLLGGVGLLALRRRRA